MARSWQSRGVGAAGPEGRAKVVQASCGLRHFAESFLSHLIDRPYEDPAGGVGWLSTRTQHITPTEGLKAAHIYPDYLTI